MKQLRLNSSLNVSDLVNSTPIEGGNGCSLFEEDSSTIKGVKIVLYSFVLITSLFGNLVIITTVAWNKRMRTTTNYLIANMATSDLLISIIAVPIQLSEIVVGPRRWLIDGTVGLILCKLSYFFQDISMAVSSQSLVVIAIDRYRGIVFPFHPAIITPKRCKIFIPLVWLTSLALHGIYFYVVRLAYNKDEIYCIFSWAPKFHPKIAQETYIIVVFLLLVVFPFSILTVLYSRIIWTLRQQRNRILGSSHLHKVYQENTKVIKNICAIMIAFACCVLPLCLYGILFFFVWKWKMPCNMEQFGFAAHFVLFSNAAITPLIYFVFNDRYRKGLKDVLKRLQFRHKDINQDIELNHLRPSRGDGSTRVSL